jgi:hypothetical protein
VDSDGDHCEQSMNILFADKKAPGAAGSVSTPAPPHRGTHSWHGGHDPDVSLYASFSLERNYVLVWAAQVGSVEGGWTIKSPLETEEKFEPPMVLAL